MLNRPSRLDGPADCCACMYNMGIWPSVCTVFRCHVAVTDFSFRSIRHTSAVWPLQPTIPGHNTQFTRAAAAAAVAALLAQIEDSLHICIPQARDIL